MQSYHVEEKATTDLLTEFPHDPTDVAQSIEDWLEGRLSAGYSLVTTVPGGSGNSLRYIFRVVAK